MECVREREGSRGLRVMPANAPPLSRGRRASRAGRTLLRWPFRTERSWLERHQLLAGGHEFLALQSTESCNENISECCSERKLLAHYCIVSAIMIINSELNTCIINMFVYCSVQSALLHDMAPVLSRAISSLGRSAQHWGNGPGALSCRDNSTFPWGHALHELIVNVRAIPYLLLFGLLQETNRIQ